MKTLNVSAGGKGERIAAYIATMSPFLPKHLLPIPTDGGTLLGEIVQNAGRNFDEVRVWSSKETYSRIVLGLEKLTNTNVSVDVHMTGPLGPLIREVLATKSRAYGCAGDFYCDFSWVEFEKFHEAHERPVSILVARSVAAPKSARFHVESGYVNSWERVLLTSKKDLINIGCYIIDPTPDILGKIDKMKAHKEDELFDLLIPERLVSGYDPGTVGFNVNVPEIYESLLCALA